MESFLGEVSMSLKFGTEIWSIKGFHQNMFTFILVGSNIWMVII